MTDTATLQAGYDAHRAGCGSRPGDCAECRERARALADAYAAVALSPAEVGRAIRDLATVPGMTDTGSGPTSGTPADVECDDCMWVHPAGSCPRDPSDAVVGPSGPSTSARPAATAVPSPA